jgi:hypothetical protein
MKTFPIVPLTTEQLKAIRTELTPEEFEAINNPPPNPKHGSVFVPASKRAA